MNKRVVITGIGVISSIGIGKDEFWNSLIAGKSGISVITSFDTTEFSNHLGAEVKNFKPQEFVSEEKIDKIGRTSLLAIAASKLALKDSGLDLSGSNREKIGVAVGTTMGETQVFEKLNAAWVKNMEDKIDPSLIRVVPASVISQHIAQELDLQGPAYVIPNACAAGNYAIGYACDLIRSGDVDIMFAGGTDAFSRIAFTGFNRLLAVAPEKVQPFDKNRKGMMVGEGAGMVVVESLEKALNRNAPIYAEILGYGLSSDAHHMTAPFSEGIKEAIEKALQESAVAAEDVDYINVHGTGTPANDKEECLAIKSIFKEHYKKVAASSIKSMLGHTMGAASAIEAIACCLSVKNDIIPPTINFETPDPECDLDCVPNVARKQKVNIALNTASAFGGNNACLVIKKFLS